jgi:L-alanine-DL-glutamate epimerase-like enolase superfamily enzyme
MESMQIDGVEAVALSTFDVLVRVRGEGEVGLGSCYPIRSLNGARLLAGYIEQILAPLIVGESATEIDRLWHKMFDATTPRHGDKGLQLVAIAGVDIALWDLFGKLVGLPIAHLLGGAFHTSFEMYASVGSGDADDETVLMSLVERCVERGFRSLKLRMHWGDHRRDVNPSRDLQRFCSVRKRVGDDARLSFDANNGYSVPTAIAQGRALERMGAYHFEEPVARYDYRGLAAVADALDIPVAAGEQEYTRWQFRDLIENGHVDIIQPDVLKCGGITEMRRIVTIAEIHNRLVVPHQNQTSIGLTASLHVMASHRPTLRPQEYAVDQPSLDDLFRGLPTLTAGVCHLPLKPGLGLEVDESNLMRLALKA